MNTLDVVLNLAQLIVADCKKELDRFPHSDDALIELQTINIVGAKAKKIVKILEERKASQ